MAKLASGTSVYGNINIATFVSAVGNVTGNYFLGNGSLLTGVSTTSSNINSGNSNVTIVAANANISIGVGGTANVAVFATTGEFITGLLSVSGNVISNNVMATNIVNVASHTGSVVSVTANVTGGNLLTGGLISATGRIFAASGNVSAPGITFSADTGQDTGFYWISDGNAGVAVNATLRAYFNTTGLSSNGTVSASGNIDGGNLRTGGLISATSTITSAANMIANNVMATTIVNVASYTGSVVSVTANVTGGNLRTGGLISATSTVTSAANVIANNVMATNIVNVASHTGAIVSVTGNITGGNILTAGLFSASGNYTVGNLITGSGTGGNISGANVIFANTVSSTANVIAGNVTTAGLISATGNITGGNITTAGVLLVNTGNAAQAITNGGSNGVGNIGSATTYFNTIFAKSTSAQYADLAEMYVSDSEYKPGTVVSFGGEYEVTLSNVPNDHRVAGVVSTNPSYLMNSGQKGECVIPVALTGRVPCLVTGTIRKGDLIVTAGNGHACANNFAQAGTIIGKSLENYQGESGMIEVVVGRV